jgi:hypothetical protein
MFYTYCHLRKNPDGSPGTPFYVGKGSGRRAYRAKGRNKHWNHVAAKHGFVVEILARWQSEKEAFDHEVFLISTFRAMGFKLVNLTDGGDGVSGFPVSAERKLHLSRLAAKQWSNGALRQEMSEQKKIYFNTAAGRAHLERAVAASQTIKNKATHRAATIAAMQDPSLRKRLSHMAKTRMQDPELRSKLSECAKAQFADPAARDAAALWKGGKPFICVQTGQRFTRQADAAQQLGLTQPHVSNILHGRQHMTKGYSFRYEDATPASEPLSQTA